MWLALLLLTAVLVLAVSRIAREIVLHPFRVVHHACRDIVAYIKYKGWNTCPVGALDIYCGYFGSGKTLSLVHKVVGLYERYNLYPARTKDRT